ncbi:MAG: hypothetical protein ABIO17_11375 [Pseudoxanthomonas sp.]
MAACASIPAISTEATLVEPFHGPAYPRLKTGIAKPVPAEVARLLLSLPARDILASQELRQRYLQGNVLVQAVDGQEGSKNYLVVDREGAWYGVWIRSFQGVSQELTGYLVEVRGKCAGLDGTDPAYAAPAAEARRQCGVTGAGYFDSGMRAYRVIEGQPPEDVTASIAPDPDVAKSRGRYADIGASEIFADDMNLDQVPVFRWTIETDPDRPLPVSDPYTFYDGHRVHAGFVVWNGEQFEKRKTVPRALWPCEKWLDDDGRVLPCPDATPEGDRFISDDQ